MRAKSTQYKPRQADVAAVVGTVAAFIFAIIFGV
jgi:hypothetical protein